MTTDFAPSLKRHYQLVVLVASLFVVLFAVALLIIYGAAIWITKDLVHSETKLVLSDLSYKNGAWDMSKYDADPEIPGTYRLYLITKDGFVIDRWRPIAGFLDTSDFKQLLVYQQPQTVTTVAGQAWRLYSEP